MDDVKLMKDATSKYQMIGGDGPHSYAHNSGYQKHLLVSAEEMLQELISIHLDPQNLPNPFWIADFGSSVGPNAFLAVENIVASVENRCNVDPIPEFHVFFNDLAGNDFNALFKALPSPRNYFCAAAPGSFHGRLFPKETLHFAHCSTALHWLSGIPEGVKDGNKGRIHYAGGGREVREAYKRRYGRDMGVFLDARGEELVGGGLMAIVVLCFPDGYVVSTDSGIGVVFEILGSCLYAMAEMGKIREEQVDSFNLPFYYPSPSELTALIEANGVFSVERIAELSAPMRVKPDARTATSHLRAVVGPIVEEHFGSGVVDELFRLHLEKLIDSPVLVDAEYWKETNYFLFLRRKS